MQLSLWDILKPLLGLRPPAPPSAKPKKAKAPPSPVRAGDGRVPGVEERAGKHANAKRAGARSKAPSAIQARYDEIVQHMLGKYEVRVRKWRTAMSGIAWYVTYKDGSIRRLIEAPRPKGPMSMAVFLHEIGHHAIGFNTYKPRCLEEYHAWKFALDTMGELKLNITDNVRRRMHVSLWYAVEKAKRRGIKEIPHELEPFLKRPARRRTGG